MYNPLRDLTDPKRPIVDALILRRYKPPTAGKNDAWTVPDDRKINPWDKNEPDPTNSGTMGTIPGPVIECSVGDTVVVHFRNLDMRGVVRGGTVLGKHFPDEPGLPVAQRTHSLHPHGFVFAPASDGAYPLSPPDPQQAIGARNARGEDETAAWQSVPEFNGQFKQGDRVPPGATFMYTWQTLGWPTTQGVWLYHDHSICDMDNVNLGAIGIIVIHPAAGGDPGNLDVDIRLPAPANDAAPRPPMEPDPQFLPGGSPNGTPVSFVCFPFPGDITMRILPQLLNKVENPMMGMSHSAMATMPAMKKGKTQKLAKAPDVGAPDTESHIIRLGDFHLELDKKLQRVIRFCLPVFHTPPPKALYLQLFHSLSGVGQMCINGRTFLGNTPTLVARPRGAAGAGTKMRFGVVGMGDDFHTFHIHGHRWVIPGPSGSQPAPQTFLTGGPLTAPVSQFEDTKIFGPANSFAFTIDEDAGLPSFMRAEPAADPSSHVGEWHMHCHVLGHMMTGMMGSLLVIDSGVDVLNLAFGLPTGVPCPKNMGGMPGMGGGGKTVNVNISNFQFPPDPRVNVGDTVIWTNTDADKHTVTDDGGAFDSSPTHPADDIPAGGGTFAHTFTTAGVFNYHCKVHAGMHGTITVT
jgi:plastocyanin/FtsP/CotA-like multicopper oxidase with cupredoxin domain